MAVGHDIGGLHRVKRDVGFTSQQRGVKCVNDVKALKSLVVSIGKESNEMYREAPHTIYLQM